MSDQEPASVISTISPPPDLTPHIVRNGDQYSAGGSFGDVYKCRCMFDSGEKEVAVKSFRFKLTMTESDGDNKAAKMICRELGIWRRLRHKNIVPFLGITYGFGLCGTMSLVSLWMPKGTLRDFLTEHDSTLNTVTRLELLLDIANGLHYLHSFPNFPIVHGDLNSNNILLGADNIARLADFGYASLVGDIPDALTYLQMSSMQPGAIRWAAPEQVLPGEAFNRTTKSDIYSFGCISLQESPLYMMFCPVFIYSQVLSGKRPWSEVQKDTHILLLLVQGQSPARPASHAIVDQHWDLIRQCWSSVDERPPAKSIITSIQGFLNKAASPALFDFVAFKDFNRNLSSRGGDQSSIKHSLQLSSPSPTTVAVISTASSPSEAWHSALSSPRKSISNKDVNKQSPSIKSSPYPRTRDAEQSHSVHHCGWVTYGVVCGAPIYRQNIAQHLSQSHNIVLTKSMGPSGNGRCCHWQGCRHATMRGKGLVRHICELHLGDMRRALPSATASRT